MGANRPRERTTPRRSILEPAAFADLAGIALLTGVAFLTAATLLAGCGGGPAKPRDSAAGIPHAEFEVQLDPHASTFVWTRVPGTSPGREPVEVELIGRNLASDPAAQTVSLEVSIRNASRIPLAAPVQVWLGAFRPVEVEVRNPDYVDPPIRDGGQDTFPGPSRFGFDYSSLLGADEVLSPGETSEGKRWEFLAPGLESFSFAATSTFAGPHEGPLIAGQVFHDLDRNGARDPGEPPVFGRLTLNRPDGTVAATGAAGDGAYAFPVQDVGLHTLFLTVDVNCNCRVEFTTPNPLRVMLLPDENGQPYRYLHADFGVGLTPHEPISPVVLTDLRPEEIRRDPYRLEVVELRADVLTLRVGFSGCTPDHDFTLFMCGSFMESIPAQALLALGHDDHGEQCDAAFVRTLLFDLRPIRRAYEAAYGQPGPVLLRISDLEGLQHRVLYEWGPAPGANLLPNGGFERDGQPTLEGWQVMNPALTSVVRSDAPEGGDWALRLEADWAPTTGFVRAPVIGFRPGQGLRLSAWMRSEGDEGGGMIYLTAGAWTSDAALSGSLEWTPVEVKAVPPIAPGDTLWVVLSSMHTEIDRPVGLFDRVVLEALPPGLMGP